MAFSWMLAAAQVGTSLIQANAQQDAARQQMVSSIERAGIEAGRAAFAGPLERFQIKRSAENAEQVRRQELAQTIGAQRAGFAASGAVGGRTQRLSLARSQAAFTRESAQADARTRMELRASAEREAAKMQDVGRVQEGAVRQAGAATRQSQISLFGNLLGVASQNQDLLETTPES